MEKHSRPIYAWIARLRDLAQDCRGAPATECSRCLARAAAIAQAAPGHVVDWYCYEITPAQISVLLDAGGFESLAIRLLGKRMSYLVSCSADGSAIATVAFPEFDMEVTSVANHPALALVSSWAGLLADAFENKVNTPRRASSH